MTHNSSNLKKIDQIFQNWQKQYRWQEEKAELGSTTTRSSITSKPRIKKKYMRVKFWHKQGHVGYNTQFKVFTDQEVFGESRKIFDLVPYKKDRHRDNDEVSESEDIEQAVSKGIAKLNQEIAIRRSAELIARREANRDKIKTKKIEKEQKRKD